MVTPHHHHIRKDVQSPDPTCLWPPGEEDQRDSWQRAKEPWPEGVAEGMAAFPVLGLGGRNRYSSHSSGWLLRFLGLWSLLTSNRGSHEVALWVPLAWLGPLVFLVPFFSPLVGRVLPEQFPQT